MVSPVTFRPRRPCSRRPSTTVDHISNGRVELGIGAGWFESEHETYGFPFLTTRGRLDELDRQLDEIDRQWTEADDVWPKPVQQPRPPIIVGGTRQAAHRRRRRHARGRVQHGLPDASTRRASGSASSTTPRGKPAANPSASR